MKNVIEIKNLKKKYDNFTLGPINLDIPSGLVIGLIGENGAGKTTLIKAILNIIKSEGEIKTLPNSEIGVVLDNMFFPEVLTPNNINTIMKSIYDTWDSKLYFKYLQDFNLDSKQIIKEMSKGMRKKLEIITALSHQPKLLILDEATSGLDPIVRNEVLELFQDFIKDDEHSIIFSSHITSDLEHIADKIVFIDKGQIVLDILSEELLDNYGILKCKKEEFKKITKTDYISYKENKYNYELLIKDKKKIHKKYPDLVIDKITLEDLMILIIKGEKVC